MSLGFIEGVSEKARAIISNQLGVEMEVVTPEAHLVDDLGADSLDVVELVMAFEEAFEIEISDEDAERIRTVHDIIGYILKYVPGLEVVEMLDFDRRFIQEED